MEAQSHPMIRPAALKTEAHLRSNVRDTALIFEGGGMRASYTAGILVNLLEQGIYFDYVAGISAGASHSANYLSRDPERARRAFIDLVEDPEFGGWKYFFKGQGFFRSDYIYERTPLAEGTMPFDFETFRRNPARLRIGAFDQNTGDFVVFRNEDIHRIEDLMKAVRASSSMPIFMPPTPFGEQMLIDGGLGPGGGIALEIARQDGMKRFFVVLSRERGYRKKPPRFKGFIKAYYRKAPLVVEAMYTRYQRYNETLETLEQLEREGAAYLVYPDLMPVSNREIDRDKLVGSYLLGYGQGRRDLGAWKAFLGLE